jgi:hypothetical protein
LHQPSAVNNYLSNENKETGRSAAPKRPVTLKDVSASRSQALRDFRDLRDEMLSLNGDASVKTIAVVTHTVPHIPGGDLLNFGDGKWSARAMSTMANTRMPALNSNACDPGSKFSTHMFGHQHEGRDETINGVRYISNPCGAPEEIRPQGALLTYSPMKVTLAPRAAR